MESYLVRAEEQMGGEEVETEDVDSPLKTAKGNSVLGNRWGGVCSQERNLFESREN